MYREYQRNLLYDQDGNLKIAGLLHVLYVDFKKPVGIFLACAISFYVYEKIVLTMSAEETRGAVLLDQQSEQVMKETGKLKSEKYLVKPRRVIEDPDFYDKMPSYASKGEVSSRLFKDDDSGSNKYQEFGKSR